MKPIYAETLTSLFPTLGLQHGMKHGERIRDCREQDAAISLQGLVGEVAWLATQSYVTQPYVLMPAKHDPALAGLVDEVTRRLVWRPRAEFCSAWTSFQFRGHVSANLMGRARASGVFFASVFDSSCHASVLKQSVSNAVLSFEHFCIPFPASLVGGILFGAGVGRAASQNYFVGNILFRGLTALQRPALFENGSHE